MRINRSLVLLGALALLISASCSKKDDPPVGPSGQDDPVLEVSSGNLAFRAGHLSETLIIRNIGTGTLTWQAESDAGWLRLSQSGGSVTPGENRIRLSCDPSGLSFGQHETDLTIRADDQSEVFSVTLDHSESELKLGMPILIFDRAHLTHHITLLNMGTSKLEFQIGSIPEWIRVDTTAGAFVEGPAQIRCIADPSTMTYGEYSNQIEISSNAGAKSITVLFTYDRLIEVYPGYAVARINLGDTVGEIRNRLGDPDWIGYDQQPDRSLIHRIRYYDLGLTIYFHSDLLELHTNKRNSGLLVENPYDGITEEEIGIGSPRDSVIAIYGEADLLSGEENSAEYSMGIRFEFDESDHVINMRIF